MGMYPVTTTPFRGSRRFGIQEGGAECLDEEPGRFEADPDL